MPILRSEYKKTQGKPLPPDYSVARSIQTPPTGLNLLEFKSGFCNRD